jgi:hypothetical protein
MTAVTSAIAVFDKSTGALQFLAPADFKPSEATLGTCALPAGFEEASFVWDATARAMSEDVAKVRAQLLLGVKAEAEARKMAFLSPGGAKKAEYAQKHAEVAFWDSLGGTITAALTAFGLLTSAARQAKFPYALADAAAFGETGIQAAIERFRVGMQGSSKVPAIAAAEAKACAAIKAATTIASARAAANVSWPT